MSEFVCEFEDKSITVLSNFSSTEVFRKNPQWNRLVLLYHGFPDTKETFEPLFKDFERRLPGVLLIAPTMRGYERSNLSKDDNYRILNLLIDTKQLIEKIVGYKKVPVHILGHDWGAILTYKYISVYPETVLSAVGLAIPYLGSIALWEYVWYVPWQLYLSSYFLTMQIPYLYRNKVSAIGDYLDGLWSYWSPNWAYTQQDIRPLKELVKDPVLVESTTAYYRANIRITALPETTPKIDFEKVPTLFIAGEVDGCMDLGLSRIAKRKTKSKRAKFDVITGAGHWMHRENPQAVVKSASEWFLEYS